jgi:hypothetical protein
MTHSRRRLILALTAARQMDSASWRFTGFGTALPDLNHDGRPDFVAVNGRVLRSGTALEFWDRDGHLNLLWQALISHHCC